MYHLAALGDVFFDVIAQEAEFPDYSFGLITTNNEVRLVDVTNALASHTPPLRLISVNNVLPSARPGNATLAANFRDGDRLQLVAAIAPGDLPESISLCRDFAVHDYLHA